MIDILEMNKLTKEIYDNRFDVAKIEMLDVYTFNILFCTMIHVVEREIKEDKVKTFKISKRELIKLSEKVMITDTDDEIDIYYFNEFKKLIYDYLLKNLRTNRYISTICAKYLKNESTTEIIKNLCNMIENNKYILCRTYLNEVEFLADRPYMTYDNLDKATINMFLQSLKAHINKDTNVATFSYLDNRKIEDKLIDNEILDKNDVLRTAEILDSELFNKYVDFLDRKELMI